MKDSTIECGAIILNPDLTKFIIVHQRVSNKWGLPKGHMTIKELKDNDKISCAVREAKEETGLELIKNENCVIIGKVNMNSKLFFVFHLLFDTNNFSPIDTNEISYVKWIKIADVNNFIQFNNSNRSLRELNKKMISLNYKINKRQCALKQ